MISRHQTRDTMLRLLSAVWHWARAFFHDPTSASDDELDEVIARDDRRRDQWEQAYREWKGY
jgi:hypothetical protein